MTKEQIENELDAMVITKYGGKHLGYYGVLEIFKEVLESLKHKTCSNCKYYNQDTSVNYCENDIVFIKDLNIISEHNDFGCNLWGSKDD